jgi:hypothetical protein
MTAPFLDITSGITSVVTSSSEPRRLLLLLYVVANLDNAVRVSDDLVGERRHRRQLVRSGEVGPVRNSEYRCGHRVDAV